MLIASNKSLAEYNLSRAEEFKEKKRQLADLYEKLQKIYATVEEKTSKLSMSIYITQRKHAVFLMLF